MVHTSLAYFVHHTLHLFKCVFGLGIFSEVVWLLAAKLIVCITSYISNFAAFHQFLAVSPNLILANHYAVYRIAGKFGRNYIWRNGLQAAKNKCWWNLNLVIGNRAYKFLIHHHVSYGRSLHVVRLKCEDRTQSHGRILTIELCSRPSHIQRVHRLHCWGKYFLRLRGLTFNATLDFSICFLKIFLG